MFLSVSLNVLGMFLMVSLCLCVCIVLCGVLFSCVLRNLSVLFISFRCGVGVVFGLWCMCIVFLMIVWVGVRLNLSVMELMRKVGGV